MLALEVEYLTGRAVATARGSRSSAEWPPHPLRLFSALVAACEECDAEEAEREGMRRALRWLETLPPPEIHVSRARKRTALVTYVPVNDATLTDGAKLLPASRSRQERFFPTMIPEDPRATFVWSDADRQEIAAHRDSLRRLAAEMVYLGHSSSLVRGGLVEDPPEQRLVWAPDASGRGRPRILRTIGVGRFEQLRDFHDRSREFERRYDPPDEPQLPYAVRGEQRDDPPETVFGHTEHEWFVFQFVPKQSRPLPMCLRLAVKVRTALMQLSDPAPPIISGHEGDRVSGRTHLAIVPLAYVDHFHADGTIKGIAVVLPRGLSLEERRPVIQALAQLKELTFQEGALGLEPVGTAENLKSLQAWQYWPVRDRWASVTPVVFGHFPRKRIDEPRMQRVVADSLAQIGLKDELEEVRISQISPIRGVPHALAFPTLDTRGKPVWKTRTADSRQLKKLDGRVRAHVELIFKRPVQGPILLGAGRYYGLGLCRPYDPNRGGR